MGEMIFEIGATAKLRSGGPLMTIAAKECNADDDTGTPVWRCAWFVNGDLRVGLFDQRALNREEVS